MPASSPPIVFCERTGAWAAAWRRMCSRRGSQAPRLRETRSANECLELVDSHPAAFVVAELTADGVEQALDLLLELNARFPQAASVVVADRAASDYEVLARELGALAFAVSPLELEPICELARRHIDRTTVEPSNVYEKIWNELPWS